MRLTISLKLRLIVDKIDSYLSSKILNNSLHLLEQLDCLVRCFRDGCISLKTNLDKHYKNHQNNLTSPRKDSFLDLELVLC